MEYYPFKTVVLIARQTDFYYDLVGFYTLQKKEV